MDCIVKNFLLFISILLKGRYEQIFCLNVPVLASFPGRILCTIISKDCGYDIFT